MAQPTRGQLVVTETMIVVLRGLRLSDDNDVAEAAIQRERVLRAEAGKLRETQAAENFSVVGDEDEGQSQRVAEDVLGVKP